MPERPAVGVAVFCWRDGRFLAQQRRKDGFWSVPGGKIEYGETPHQAGAREVREETGLIVQPRQGVLEVTTDLRDGKHWVTIWIEAECLRGEPVTSREAAAFRWSAMYDLPSPLWQPFWDNLRGQLCLIAL
jgi:8-oxo-dGTP diphosphatase